MRRVNTTGDTSLPQRVNGRGQTRKRGFLSGGSSILTGRLATTRRRHTLTGVTEDYRILALTT